MDNHSTTDDEETMEDYAYATEEDRKAAQRRKGGHMTLENVYVVGLVSAWASTILLLMLVSVGLLAAIVVPSDLGSTLLSGYNFFQSVSDGYHLGVRQVAKQSQPVQSMEYAISEYVQWFYSVPWRKVRSMGSTGKISHLSATLQKSPKLVDEAREIISFIGSKLRNIPILGAALPPEYYFPTQLAQPGVVQVIPDEDNTASDDSDEAQRILPDDIIGDYYALCNLTCDHFVKETDRHLHILSPATDEVGVDESMWKIHEATVSEIVNVPVAHNEMGMIFAPSGLDLSGSGCSMKATQVQFWKPNADNAVVLDVVLGTNAERDWFQGGAYSLKPKRSSSGGWDLYEAHANGKRLKVDSFEGIAPLMDKQQRERSRWGRQPHDKIAQVSVAQVGISCDDETEEEVDGVYDVTRDEQVWDMYGGLISMASAMEGATTWRMTELIDEETEETVVGLLTHSVVESMNKKGELSHVVHLTQVHSSRVARSVSGASSLQAVKWDVPITASRVRGAMLPPLVRSVVLEYVLGEKMFHSTKQWRNADPDTIRALLMEPYLLLKMDTLFLRLRTPLSAFETISIDAHSIDASAQLCDTSGRLTVRPLKIASDLLGGLATGSLRVRFADEGTCQQWLLTVDKFQASYKTDNKLLKNRFWSRVSSSDVLGFVAKGLADVSGAKCKQAGSTVKDTVCDKYGKCKQRVKDSVCDKYGKCKQVGSTMKDSACDKLDVVRNWIKELLPK